MKGNSMKLQDKLDKMREDFENGCFPLKPTAKQLQIMLRATKTLVESGQADRALKAGDKAPEFSLTDANGNIHNSRDLLERSSLVVTFYRGVWCPYCNVDLAALEAERSEIEARGAGIVAISPQTAGNSRKSQRDNRLSFPILTDTNSEIAETFGIRFSLPDDLIELYKSFGNDLAQINAGRDWRLPMPARYVIGRDGMIGYAEVNPDYTRRPDPSDLLPILDRLKAD
jgi:peroxiredoxin